MYKILIVDDDYIIRKGFSQNIAWSEHGFELVGTASDGEEALQIITDRKPDIVISDIKMPFMDGLQMSKVIKAKYPEIKIILVTGYEEFSFAKEAIKLRTFDYEVKPVDNDQLLDKVRSAAREINAERQSNRQIKEGVPLLRQQFLRNFVNGSFHLNEIGQELQYLGLPLNRTYFELFIIKIDDYAHPEIHRRFQQTELLKYCVANICEELLRSGPNGMIYGTGEDEFIVLINEDRESKDALMQMIYAFAENLRVQVQTYLKTTITIGLGSIYTDPVGLKASYKEARSALDLRIFTGKNRVLSTQGHFTVTNSEKIEWHGRDKEILSMIKRGLLEEALGLLGEMQHILIEKQFTSLHQLRIISLELVVSIHRELDDWGEAWLACKGELDNIYENIEFSHTVEDIFDILRRSVAKVTEFVLSRKETQPQKTVGAAVDYIQRHYADESLSLQDVAKAVNVSVTYLSFLFKQEKKMNFTDFVLETRMKQAMELFKREDLKGYEVADKVGYSNPQYFSSSFKKYSGMSPSEFKKE